MASNTVPAGQWPAHSSLEHARPLQIIGDDDTPGRTAPAALLFNPACDTEAFATALAARARRLHELLNAWAIMDPTDGVTTRDLAAVCEPLADELSQFAEELANRLPRPSAGSASDSEVGHD